MNRLQRMLYKQAMLKTAGPELMSVVRAGQTLIAQAPAVFSASIIAAGLVGAGAGAFAAKMSAHDNADIDAAKMEYDNERLKADIGYLGGQLRQEREAMKNTQKPKAARVLG